MVAKLSRENAYRKALEVYDALPAIGLMADTAITNAAISACDKGAAACENRELRHQQAGCFFPGLKSRRDLDWPCNAGGQWQHAMSIFHKMEALGLRRDAITYSSTISALAKGKQWSLALQVMCIMAVIIATFSGLFCLALQPCR